jgi:hypothetical protein
MPDRRLRLSELLRGILGSKEVYFQRPESKKMNYPAIVYELSDIPSLYANDGVYLSGRTYSVTLIDKDPDSPLVGKIAALPACRFDRPYRADNLNHWVFTLHY